MAVAAIVALGVGALVAVGSSNNDGVALAEPFSLAAAAQYTIDARSVEFDLTVSAGDLGDVTVAERSTTRRARVGVDRPVGTVVARPDVADRRLDRVDVRCVDGRGLHLGRRPRRSAPGRLGVGVRRPRRARRGVRRVARRDPGRTAVDPAESARMLLDSDKVVEVGNETIDGVDTVHDEVTVDVAAAIAASPQAWSKPTRSVLTSRARSNRTSLRLGHLRNQLRRASFDVTVADHTVAMALDMRPSDEPLATQVPTESFDITGLLDGEQRCGASVTGGARRVSGRCATRRGG